MAPNKSLFIVICYVGLGGLTMGGRGRGVGGDDDDSVVLGGEARQLTRPGRHFPSGGAHTT